MIALLRAAALLTATAGLGCSLPAAVAPDAGSGDEQPCGACPDGKVCDPERMLCVTALAEGAVCDGLDGGIVEGRCGAGMSCGSDGSNLKRCGKDCTAATADALCGPERTCLARPDAPKATSGFCVTRALEGGACDSAKLIFCSAPDKPLVCVAPSADQTAGRCFALCDPQAPACATGQECADPFPADPNLGICVRPDAGAPHHCDYAALQFCGRGELCIRPTEASWGFCHRRCTAQAECRGGQSCVHPGTEPFCALPLDRCPSETDAEQCPSCDPVSDRFCGPADLCVLMGDWPVCKQDCSSSQACEAGSCVHLGTTATWVCL